MYAVDIVIIAIFNLYIINSNCRLCSNSSKISLVSWRPGMPRQVNPCPRDHYHCRDQTRSDDLAHALRNRSLTTKNTGRFQKPKEVSWVASHLSQLYYWPRKIKRSSSPIAYDLTFLKIAYHTMCMYPMRWFYYPFITYFQFGKYKHTIHNLLITVLI